MEICIQIKQKKMLILQMPVNLSSISAHGVYVTSLPSYQTLHICRPSPITCEY